MSFRPVTSLKCQVGEDLFMILQLLLSVLFLAKKRERERERGGGGD